MKLYRLANSFTVPLSMFLAILATVHGDGDPNSSKYCTNEKCRIAADELLKARNSSINPCDDFYTHMCNGRKGSYLFYTNKKIHTQIAELFENTQPDDMKVLNKAKKFLDVCTNRAARKRRGLRPIEKILSDNGEWPLTVPSDEWNNQNRSWQEMHANFMRHTSISPLFDITVEADRRNTGAHILSLGVPTVPSERVHFVARPKREARSSKYRQYVVDVVGEMKKLRGFDVNYDDLLADPEGVIRFEDELVKLAINLDEDYNANSDDLRITTIETLQNEWDAVIPKISKYSINWLNAINDRFEGTNIVIDASEKIALKPAAFVEKFARMLTDTPVRTIVNYIHWKVIDNLVNAAYTKLRNPHASPRALAVSYSGTCIVGHTMMHAVAYIYVKRYFNVQSKSAVLEMIQNIKDEIKREISESSWLDDAGKSVTQKKIDAITSFVGYPSWYDEPGKIDEYYRDFTVGPDHFENVLAYLNFASKKQLSKLRSPVDETETDWIALPFIANAEYLPQPNAISIPTSIFQWPFLVYERPSVLNYGALGAIIGHEISHALDRHGRFYDEAGVKRKWWSQSAIDTYKTKAQCFVKQYDEYTVNTRNGTVHLNGTETLGENIADTMGFRASLRAYRSIKNNGKTNNVKIQLLSNFTDEKLYFHELAYTLCAKRKNPNLETRLTAHSPARLRINGALSNMKEFSDAFDCPLGSPMNPLEKCLIWD